MLRNYARIAFRNLLRHKGYAFINIFGLAIGLAACVLILLFVRHELTYDRFHEKAARIYRVGLDASVSGTDVHAAVTSAALAPLMLHEYPEVEQAARFREEGEALVAYGDLRYYEKRWLWADSTTFSLFTFPFVQGDPATALDRPYTVVLTESTAQRYFGEENPIGKTLRLHNEVDYEVTGVLEDLPSNTHLPFDFLASLFSREWLRTQELSNNNIFTYILLRDGADPEALKAKFPALVETHVAPDIEKVFGSWEQAKASGFKWGYFLEPLTRIHLHSTTQNDIAVRGDVRYVYVLLAVAVFILLIACINFMNLSTARSAGRAKEVGVRKVVGSGRGQLIAQFLGESLLLSLAAAVLAFGIALAASPLFGSLTGREVAIGVSEALSTFGVLTGVALVAGLLAGAYPALVLSSFQPAAVLKGSLAAGAKGVWLRRTLVVLQFGISMVLLVGTGVVFKQLRFMQEQKLGFAGDQVVVLPLKSGEARQHITSLRERLLRNPAVVEVSAAAVLPGRFLDNLDVYRPEGRPQTELHPLWGAEITHEYAASLQLELAAGRHLSRERDPDPRSVALINEAAARLIGWTPEEAVGRTLTDSGSEEAPRTIVGVLKDFHVESLAEPVKPAIFHVEHADSAWMNYVLVRVRPETVAGALSAIEAEWPSFSPGFPYEYVFLSDDFARLYEEEQNLGKIFGVFAALAVFVACLGLFGLASFTTQQRTKEIGVRKVLGASAPSIVLLLSKEFTRMVLVAAVIAFPVAYLVMQEWLAGFAFRTGLGAEVFVAAGVLALAIALLTVSYQSVKAATADPVKSLRYE